MAPRTVSLVEDDFERRLQLRVTPHLRDVPVVVATAIPRLDLIGYDVSEILTTPVTPPNQVGWLWTQGRCTWKVQ